MVSSLVSIISVIKIYALGFPAEKLGHLIEPWVKALVAPHRLIWIALACVIAFLYLVRQPLWLFAKRLYAWSIYEGTVISAMCAFAIWRRPFWWALAAFGAGIFLLCAIAWTRVGTEDQPDHL